MSIVAFLGGGVYCAISHLFLPFSQQLLFQIDADIAVIFLANGVVVSRILYGIVNAFIVIVSLPAPANITTEVKCSAEVYWKEPPVNVVGY